jgi:hypothetical protein
MMMFELANMRLLAGIKPKKPRKPKKPKAKKNKAPKLPGAKKVWNSVKSDLLVQLI